MEIAPELFLRRRQAGPRQAGHCRRTPQGRKVALVTVFCQNLSMRPSPPNYGRFSSEQEALRAVVQRLAAALHPLSIYLFGSRAEGRARPDSDFDLLVVFDDQAPNADADYDEVYGPLLGIGIGCDVIPCRESELLDVLGDSTNPWQDSLASAKRVYEQPA